MPFSHFQMDDEFVKNAAECGCRVATDGQWVRVTPEGTYVGGAFQMQEGRGKFFPRQVETPVVKREQG